MATNIDTTVRRARLVKSFGGQIRDRAVLDAINLVPREHFLDESLSPRAYDDDALPIGFAQTTSQPFVIARMLEMMRNNKKLTTVLEIGSGSGYQSALLSLLCERVFCIERIRTLANKSKRRLSAMGYNNVKMIHGDGFCGHSREAPYDGIVICAENAIIPLELPTQLSPEGRLVMPLIGNNGVRLVAINASGKIIRRREQVNFVPLTKGWA